MVASYSADGRRQMLGEAPVSKVLLPLLTVPVYPAAFSCIALSTVDQVPLPGGISQAAWAGGLAG